MKRVIYRKEFIEVKDSFKWVNGKCIYLEKYKIYLFGIKIGYIEKIIYL